MFEWRSDDGERHAGGRLCRRELLWRGTQISAGVIGIQAAASKGFPCSPADATERGNLARAGQRAGSPTTESIGFPDGSLNAPTSTGNTIYNTVTTFYQRLPFSTVLNRYKVRPPWKVAGVDYPVGINRSALPLKDPATITAIPNSTIYRSGSAIIIGANQTLDGYDMSLSGGYQAQVNGANATIQNCHFRVGSSALVPIVGGASGATDFFTLQYCVLDGNSPTFNMGPDHNAGTLSVNSGHMLVQYNYFIRANGEHIVSGGTTVGQVRDHITIQFNVFGDAGRGEAAYGTHGDIIQLYSAQDIPSQNWSNIIIQFNTVCLDDPAVNHGGAQGLSLFAANIAQSYVTGTCSASYNTFCASASNVYAGIQSLALFIPANYMGSIVVSNNYADMLNCVESQASPTNPQNNPFITYFTDTAVTYGNTGRPVRTITGNVSLTTGNTLTALSGYGGNSI